MGQLVHVAREYLTCSNSVYLEWMVIPSLDIQNPLHTWWVGVLEPLKAPDVWGVKHLLTTYHRCSLCWQAYFVVSRVIPVDGSEILPPLEVIHVYPIGLQGFKVSSKRWLALGFSEPSLRIQTLPDSSRIDGRKIPSPKQDCRENTFPRTRRSLNPG